MNRFSTCLASVVLSTILLLATNAAESLATQPQLMWTSVPASQAWGCSFGVAMDTSGNLYTAGMSDGTVFGVTSTGDKNYIAKYSPNGILLWGNQWASSGSYFSGVAVDGSANVVVSDANVAKKFDATGNLLWKCPVNHMGYDIAVDSTGNSYIAGASWNWPQYPTISKIDPAGKCLWTTQLTSLFPGQGWAIAVDASGDAVITGHSTYDPTTGTQFGFVARLDSAGNLLWDKQYGSQNTYTDVTSVAIDGSGGIYVTGGLGASIPGASGTVLVKYDVSGNQQWFRDVAYDGNRMPIALDPSGGVYVSSSYNIEEFSPLGQLINQFPMKNVGVGLDLAYGNGAFGTAHLGGSPLMDSRVSYYAAPEPSTLALLVIGSAALLGRKLRKRK